MASQPQLKTVLGHQPCIELDNGSEKLRFSLQKAEYCLGRDRTWSDFEIPEQGWNVLSGRHAILRLEGQGYRIFDGDGQGKSSTNGLFFNYTRIDSTQGYLLEDNGQIEIGQDPQNRIVLTYINPNSAMGAALPRQRHLDLNALTQWPLILGRSPDNGYAQMELEAPTISRRHASISRDGQGNLILHDHSTNGTFLNDQRIIRPTRLQEGDRLRIGPFTLLLRRGVLELADQGTHIRLDAHDLALRVQKNKVILEHVTLAIQPGQLVAIVGGSGAGKSTLMKTLLGISPTTSGAVYLNGDDLRRNFGLYRHQIGYVPQDDIVHPDLTVEEVLSYACRLRLPPDVNVTQVIDKTLEQVKLSHVRTNFVKHLSGGQRKRVSIGVELLADPKLFFLDEPTSGLDPGLDKEMMGLLKDLAKQGRTIVLVTHATSNIKVCDRLVFMGRGGRLCYFGAVEEVMAFFQMPSQDLTQFADIYLKLDQGPTPADVQQNVQTWSERFINSTIYQKYVAAYLSPGNQTPTGATHSAPQGVKISPFQQLWVLSKRYLTLVLRDRISLALALFTAPFSIALVKLPLNAQAPLAPPTGSPELTQAGLALQVILVVSCAAVWVGLSGAAQEIVKEGSIYARERLVNLGLFPYLGSKVLVRAGLAILQTLLVVGVVLLGFDPPEPDFIAWPVGLGITTFLTLMASVSLGFMISTFVKNENQANNMLPLILLPQIVFSGVLFNLDNVAEGISWLMISRWSINSLSSLVDVNSMAAELPTVPGSEPLEPPFQPSDVYDATWGNLQFNWAMLILHILVYLAIALWQQRSKDVFKSGLGRKR